MFDIFQYDFIVRGLEAGLIIGAIAPIIGMFLVLRRYSLIADTLSHVSLAGVALGLFLNINPFLTAIGAAVGSSVIIEKLRLSKRVYGDSALSIFLSGSLAFAILLIGLAHGFSTNLFTYLFGSIVTVSPSEVIIILITSIMVLFTILTLYKELVFITFDEEAAQVSGLPTKRINTLLIILSALTVALAIPIVGMLLISALIVIPVITALQYKKSFLATILYAEVISLCCVFLGILTAFRFDLPAGGTIVLLMIGWFILTLSFRKLSK